MTRESKFGIGVLLTAIGLLTLVACSGAQADSKPIKATWIKPEVASNTVSISAGEIERNRMTHFAVGAPPNEITFMAYVLDGKTYVRADICPPCRSESFSLSKNKLVCDACGTVFDAVTGKGVQGACVAYAKQPVQFQVADGKLMMTMDDLVTAFRNTLRPKLS